MDNQTIITLMGAGIVTIIALAKFEKDAFSKKSPNIKVVKSTKKKHKRSKRKKKYQDYIEAAWNEVNN